jgi:REP element-mobilizing transposase RayT
MRLPTFDYATPGAYFFTVIAHERASLFGRIIDSVLESSHAGDAVLNAWLALPTRFDIELDAFVLMPNHVHGIVWLPQYSDTSAMRRATLPTVMRAFKSTSAIAVNRVLRRTGPVWQRSYFERVIRNEPELEAIRRYVIENPLRWAIDHENQTRD